MNSPATIAFKCSCGHGMKAKQEHGGRRAKCPKCQQAVTIPVAGPQNSRPTQTRSQSPQPQPQPQRPQTTSSGQAVPRPEVRPNQTMPGAPMPGAPMPAPTFPGQASGPIPPGQMPPGQMPPPGFPGVPAPGTAMPVAPMPAAPMPGGSFPGGPSPGGPLPGTPMAAPAGQGNLPLGYSVPAGQHAPAAGFPSPSGSGPGKTQPNSMAEQACPSCGSFYPFSQPHCAKCRFSRALGKKIPYQSFAQPVARMQAPPPRPKKKSPDDERFGMKVLYMTGGLVLTLIGFGIGALMMVGIASSEGGRMRVRAFFLPAFIIASGFGMMAKGFASD